MREERPSLPLAFAPPPRRFLLLLSLRTTCSNPVCRKLDAPYERANRLLPYRRVIDRCMDREAHLAIYLSLSMSTPLYESLSTSIWVRVYSAQIRIQRRTWIEWFCPDPRKTPRKGTTCSVAGSLEERGREAMPSRWRWLESLP